MEEMVFKLSELVSPPNTDSISGRSFGEDYSKRIKLLSLLDKKNRVVFEIDDNVVKAINDSFIKGLFSSVFEKYKTIKEVEQRIKINSSDYYKRLFLKNWQILQAVENV